MSKVLIVATSRKTRGGITAVIKAHESGEQWRKYNCIWVQTHRDGSSARKILYFISAIIYFTLLLPFSDIVHIHHSLPGSTHRKYYFFRLAKLLRKKTIVHLHCGNQLLECWNDEYQDMYSRCDIGVALSNNIKLIIESHVGNRNNLRVIFNPCPVVSIEPKLIKTKTILFSGTLYEGKGYRDLIRAFAKVAYKYPEWKLVFAGNGELKVGQVIAKENNVIDQCVFLGWVSGETKDHVFREASIFCLPSYAEGFPMAVLDAWAYGLPVITTPVGGIPDVAKNGENLLLFNPGDIDTLAGCLDKMISDKYFRDKIAQESLTLANTTFNIDTINKQISEMYCELSQ